MSFVLDSSAVLTYLSDLPGSDLLDEILDNANSGKVKVYISYLTISELYYIIGSEFSPRKANDAIAAVKRWPVTFVPVDESIALAAGRLMAQEEISLQDAVVIATALDKGAALVTADEKLGEVFDDTIVLGQEGES